MYFEDLSEYVYSGAFGSNRVVNVGWLDTNHQFRTAECSNELLDRLFDLCLSPVNVTRGFHQCSFCVPDPWGIEVIRNSQRVRLGSAEIRVSGDGGIVYASPDLIFHYVEVHQYSPPEEFVNAVLRSTN